MGCQYMSCEKYYVLTESVRCEDVSGVLDYYVVIISPILKFSHSLHEGDKNFFFLLLKKLCFHDRIILESSAFPSFLRISHSMFLFS